MSFWVRKDGEKEIQEELFFFVVRNCYYFSYFRSLILIFYVSMCPQTKILCKFSPDIIGCSPEVKVAPQTD